MTENDNLVIILYGLCAAGAVILLLYFFFLNLLVSLIREIAPENRSISPGLIWLLLIPIFNMFWNFVVVKRIAVSIREEYRSRNLTPEEDYPAYNTGLIMCIFNIVSLVPIFGRFLFFGTLIFWILYWTKVAGYRNKLRELNSVL